MHFRVFSIVLAMTIDILFSKKINLVTFKEIKGGGGGLIRKLGNLAFASSLCAMPRTTLLMRQPLNRGGGS